MRKIFLSLGLVLISLGFSPPSSALDFSSVSPPVDSDPLLQRGKQLRADLEHVYKHPTEKPKSPLWGIDVNTIIAKYIPIGTSFEDAERILQAAGFKMAPRPPRPVEKDSLVKFNEALRFAMVGGLELDSIFLVSKTSVSVTLFPDSPGDQNAHVKEIHASLHTTYL